MKKLISLAAALALCLSVAGSLTPPLRFAAMPMSASAADDAVTDIDDILPKRKEDAAGFIEKYGQTSVHGRYVVDFEYLSGFYNNSGGIHSDPGNGMKSYELVQDGSGELKIAKYYDLGSIMPDDAYMVIVFEADKPGDVEFMATYGGGFKTCFIHRNYSVAEDLSITLKSVGDAEGYEYFINEDDSCGVRARFINGEDVNIPAEINGHAVTDIGDEGFHGISLLKTVTIPEGIKRIGADSFAYCSGLEKITILNPDCEIDDGKYGGTICSGFDDETKKHYYNGVICGIKGSTAEKYAEEHGYRFEEVGASPAEELEGILPRTYKAMQEFIKENSTVSIHGKYVVFCGNIADAAVNKNILTDLRSGGESFE